MELFSNLEVRISCKDSKYRAVCDAFPKCVGVGNTEKDALDKLSGSIARFVGSVTKQSLQSVFSSNNYSDVILDASHPKKEQRRIFSMDSDLSTMTKSLFVKVDLSDVNKKTNQPNDIKQFLKATDPDVATQSIQNNISSYSNTLDRILQEKGPREGFVFGFPLSFN